MTWILKLKIQDAEITFQPILHVGTNPYDYIDIYTPDSDTNIDASLHMINTNHFHSPLYVTGTHLLDISMPYQELLTTLNNVKPYIDINICHHMSPKPFLQGDTTDLLSTLISKYLDIIKNLSYSIS